MDTRPGPALIRAAGFLARAVVGLAFLVAGTTKAVHPAVFIADIWSYRLVPESAAVWLAAFLPWLEIATGAALITGRQVNGARLVAALLLVTFLGAIALSWARGLDISCGCFGPAADGPSATDYPWLLTRDLLLIACLATEPVLGFWRRRRRIAVPAGATNPPA